MTGSSKPILEPEAYVSLIREVFLAKGDPVRAEQQRAYMRHQFDYCGLRAPEWMALLKTIFTAHGTFTGKDLKKFVEVCYAQEYRELHYAGLEMMQRRLKEQSASWIRVLERCIQTESWWDTVDWLAKLTGMHFKRFPEWQHLYAYQWIRSDNLWLQRVAIIHQLFYREETDEKLLFDMIRYQEGNKEFFIQKACGWALRQYAKTKPGRVRWFIDHHPVSALALREARKQLNR